MPAARMSIRVSAAAGRRRDERKHPHGVGATADLVLRASLEDVFIELTQAREVR